ncbi:MAG: hypothetical protein RLZZ500_743 [Bacteroidota bacterium]|jgi:hypothetical protein
MALFTAYPITKPIHYTNLALFLSFQCCGIVWKKEALCIPHLEYTIFSEGNSLWDSLTHPLILTGLFGQVLLLLHAFNRRWNRKINTLTVSLLAVLAFFLASLGALTHQWTMVFMQVPFLVVVGIYFKLAYKKTGA